MTKKILGALGALLLVALVVTPAFAAIDVTVTGTVLSVDTVGGTFQIGTEGGDTYTVAPPAGFDLTTLTVGDTVQVSGSLEGTDLTATSVAPAETTIVGTIQTIDPTTCSMTILGSDGITYTVEPPAGFDCSSFAVGDTITVTGGLADTTLTASSINAGDTTGEEGEFVNTGFYCSNPEIEHPALSKVAEAHEVDYATVLDWFCHGGLGVGGVNLALTLSEKYGVPSDQVLEMRKTMGWGKIKKELESASEDTLLTPTSGHGHGHGHGGGKPSWAGKGGKHGH